MKESDYKAKWCKAVRDEGSYARRLEDQYGAGIPDMYWMLYGGQRPLWIEAKIIRGLTFGPTPRQLEELKRLNSSPLCNAIVLGYHPDTKMFHYGPPAEKLKIGECNEASTLASLLNKLRML